MAAARPIDQQYAKLLRTHGDLKLSYKNVCTQVAELERQVEAFIECRGDIAVQHYERLKKKRLSGTTVGINCSDWHYEERVDPKTVGGLNSFDVKEADKRIAKLWRKSVEMIDFVRHLAPVRSIAIGLLGDFISGYIHDELVEGNQLSPTEATLRLQEVILGGLEFIHKETKLPIDIITCQGNHGRTTQKRRVATSYRNSYEWMMYHVLRYRSIDRGLPVRWHIGNGYHNVIEIEGHKVRYHHGDAIRYHGGVGGITIPVNKSIAQWNKANSVDLDVFGHWHTYQTAFPTWISNGCLIGYGPYAVEIKADYQQPTQSLFVMDREKGLTIPSLPIFVT